MVGAGILDIAFGQPSQGSVKVTLDQALQMAVQHNQALLAARTTVQQSLAQEVTANLRPNPPFTAIWAYLPLYRTEEGFLSYLHDQTEFDAGLSYLKERGHKRQFRLQAAKDGTAVTRSQVEDNERTLKFQVASQFINVQLAESVLDLAQQNLASYQRTVDLGEAQFKGGAISENDFLKIKLQLVQYQTDLQQAQLSRVQALSDLRQLLGHETVPADYTITGTFDYQPLVVTFDELQAKALQNRPDLRGATGRVRGQQPICVGQGQRKAGCHLGRQLFAFQRLQHFFGQHEYSAGDFRPELGRNRANQLRDLSSPLWAERDQWAGDHGCERRV
jgi:cobalt-zinc-cadmium efflux system outer membrane protein